MAIGTREEREAEQRRRQEEASPHAASQLWFESESLHRKRNDTRNTTPISPNMAVGTVPTTKDQVMGRVRAFHCLVVSPLGSC